MRVLFITSLLVGIVIISCREEKIKEPYITGMEGKPLPDFAIQLMDSVSWLHSKNIPQGKQFILFYYSPTCPYCRAQMRDMVNNIEIFKEKQLYILSDTHLPSIKQFVNYFDLDNYPNVIIGRDTGSVILRKYGLISVPFTAYFDKNKNLKVAYSGRLHSNTLLRIR